MSVVFTDSFTVGSNTNLDAYPSGSADYAYNLGSGAEFTVNAANDRIQQTVTGTDDIVRIINSASPTNGVGIISATLFGSSGNDSTPGLMVRVATDGTQNGYMAYYYNAQQRVTIYRVTPGAFTQLTDVGRALSPPQTCTFKAVTNGSQVDLTATAAGVADVTYSDSTGGRFLSGAFGIHMFSATANVAYIDNISIDDLQAGGQATSSNETHALRFGMAPFRKPLPRRNLRGSRTAPDPLDGILPPDPLHETITNPAFGWSPVKRPAKRRALKSTPLAPETDFPLTVEAAPAFLTLTTFAPVVTAGGGMTLTPDLAVMTLTTFAPSVIIGTIVTPDLATLALATFAPTVQTPISVIPGFASLTLSTFAPAISTPVTVTPSIATLTLTTFAPTVTTGASVTVTPDVATLTLATFAPTVQNPLSVTPGTANLTLGTFVPSVQTPIQVTPAQASLVISTFAPSISTPVSITPDPAALTLTGFAPSITTSGSVSVTPDPASLILTTFAPLVTAEEPRISGNPNPYKVVWKRPRETYRHVTTVQMVLTIESDMAGEHVEVPAQPSIDLEQIKREAIQEAERFIESERARKQDEERQALASAQEVERQRMKRQDEDDAELVMAASVLFRDEPVVTWRFRMQPRRR